MKPILFNTEMVKAILDGRKRCTRRVADINQEIACTYGEHEFVWDNFAGGTATGFVCRKCGFGVAPPHSRYPVGTSVFRPRYWPGDILYVRETFCENPAFGIHYRADWDNGACPYMECDDRWHPSIHMPKEAARIFLRVTDVRVERLQDITADECPMEGVWPLAACTVGERDTYYRSKFAELWDSTLKPAALPRYGWAANPWVWAIKFERISKEKALKGEHNEANL